MFISEEYADNKIYDAGLVEKSQFFVKGRLNFRRVLEKFVESFDSLYGDRDETFLEDAGRRYFMLFLKPIINGVGNSYVEAQTRNRERMDLVVDLKEPVKSTAQALNTAKPTGFRLIVIWSWQPCRG